MKTRVYDSSALLAVVFSEPGASDELASELSIFNLQVCAFDGYV